MRCLIVIFAFILASSLALAPVVTQPARASVNYQSPISNLQFTLQTTTTLPYEFEPIDFERPDLPTLGIDLLDVEFINNVGSMALTLFTIFDKYYILGIFMVILVSLIAVAWLWTYVTDRPSQVELKVSELANVSAGLIDRQSAGIQDGLTYYEENHLALGDGASDRYQMDRARLQSNRQLSSGIRQGSKLFRRARRDFGGNPFK